MMIAETAPGTSLSRLQQIILGVVIIAAIFLDRLRRQSV
jgi:ribose/xylose/arabinose/galactoside ABC-type transport system permease subunit